MFGYVRVCKEELKIKEYNVFRAYYCGLCKLLGEKYNQLVRLGLSYDLTFLAILADSLCDDKPEFEQAGCVKHIAKHKVCKKNSALEYSADMSIALTYYKLSDDVHDDHSLKAIMARIPYSAAVKKVKNKYPQLCDIIVDQLKALDVLEQQNCCNIDQVADCFAVLMRAVFVCVDPHLAELGYNIGRYIYIADAYKDLEEDRKKRSYNPYLCLPGDYNAVEIKRKAAGSVHMTLAAIAACYEKLQIQKNNEILDNIIYMGLRAVTENLFMNTEES